MDLSVINGTNITTPKQKSTHTDSHVQKGANETKPGRGRTGSAVTHPPTVQRMCVLPRLKKYAGWYFRVYVRVRLMRRDSSAQGYPPPLGPE